jgi:choline dehydrogenase
MRMREVAHAPSLANITTREVTPGPEVRTRAEWEAHVRATAYHHFHVCGTCRMGQSVADSVTDTKLRVHGLKGLRVVDGSVMPLLMNANTNAAVMVVAERGAEAMLAG